jgi:hypothetical protein
VNDFDRVRDIGRFQQLDRDDLPLSGQSVAMELRADLHQEKPRGLGLRAPVGDLGKPANFLQHLHYFYSRRHTVSSQDSDCSSRAIRLEISLALGFGFD